MLVSREAVMVVGNSLTAFRMWLASVFWHRAGPGRHHAVTFVPALLLAFILPGCASVDVLRLSSETFTPQTSHVEILERAPTRPYVPIAVLTVDSWWLSLDSRSGRKFLRRPRRWAPMRLSLETLLCHHLSQAIALQERALRHLHCLQRKLRSSCQMICIPPCKRGCWPGMSGFS